eukprot:GHUV01014227.1.p1 GENE.GHUV01014227.1~~GHUV01014227.1.p1  ORF type:complete len:152 (+),score=37.38 GHUV01014227.1:399-854(+)
MTGLNELRFRSSAPLLPCTAEGAPNKRVGAAWYQQLRERRAWTLVVALVIVLGIGSIAKGVLDDGGVLVGWKAKQLVSSSPASSRPSILGTVKAEKAAFLAQSAGQYGYNGWLDKNWQAEVGNRLGSSLQHYLDFTACSFRTRHPVQPQSS